ncbi:MAG: histidine phosphatase family protein, partial [Pseudomonadota bacterium]
MPIPLKPFIMIRHGQTTANAEHKLSGHTDVKLSKQGKAEATAAKDLLSEQENKPSIIIHSRLTRAKQTAEIINKALKLDIVEHPHIHEQNFGDWEEKGIGLYLESYNERANPPNCETFDQFDERIRSALNEILTEHDNPLIVCHGG